MKGKNKILVGCLALLLVLSVGYALFSETITINGTATAKGDFDITTTCDTGIISKIAPYVTIKNGEDIGYANDTCQVVDNKVSLSTDFLYPGASRYFTVKITNSGSIDATYNPENMTDSEELCVADDLEGNNLSCFTASDSGNYVSYKGYYANLAWSADVLEDLNGNLLSQNQILEFYDPTTGILNLKPGYSIYVCFKLYIKRDTATEPPSNEMFVNYTSTFEFPFTQAAN